MKKNDGRQSLARIRATFLKMCNNAAYAETIHSELQALTARELVQQQGNLNSLIEGILEETASYVHNAGWLACPWDSQEWGGWQPVTEFINSARVRIGDFFLEGAQGNQKIPALAPFIGGPGLLFHPPQEKIGQTKKTILGILLRLLAAFPPGKLRFVFIDPVGRGDSVAALMHLLDHDPRLVSGKAWTETTDIEKQLLELTGHIEYVIQKYLRNTYKTIEDYNTDNTSIPEPYRVLVAFDFPMNFSVQSAQRLLSIAQSGPRCGVIPIILVNDGIEKPHGFSMDSIKQHLSVINTVWQAPSVENFVLELDFAPTNEITSKIVDEIGRASTNTEAVLIPFEKIAPPPEKWWSPESDIGTSMTIALGPKDAKKNLYMTIGESRSTAHHVLMAGKTGSGKSTLLHTMIMNLALTYSPDDLELYLIDFKKVEFKLYAVHRLPHARVIAVESDREFGLSVLESLYKIMDNRLRAFSGVSVVNIEEYRKKTGQKMPRILLLMDEFQILFQEDDNISTKSSHFLDNIVRLGRAPGIHVVMASQTLANAVRGSSRTTLGQMGVRIALQCSESDSSLILGENNNAARLLDRPGEAIYNDKEGRHEENTRFQVAWLPQEEREQLLQALDAKGEQGRHGPIIFEGTGLGTLTTNSILRDFKEQRWPPLSREALAFLGEPVTLDGHVCCRLRRRTGANMLVLGTDLNNAVSILGASLLGLAAQFAPDSASFHLLILTGIDELGGQPLVDLASTLPHHLKVGRSREIAAIVEDLGKELDERFASTDTDLARREKPVFLFILGLQRGKELRQDDKGGFAGGGFNIDSPSKPPAASIATVFRKLLHEGPELGMHVLAWCDTLRNLERTLDREVLEGFGERVALQLQADDSQRFIDSRSGAVLGPYRGLCYSEDDGTLVKFRPYDLKQGSPSLAWALEVSKEMNRSSAEEA